MNFSRISGIFTLLAVFTVLGGSGLRAQNADEHLKISLKLAADTVASGGSSEILLSFTPRKGFHVNAIPPVGFALDSGSAALLADTTIVPRDTATGYLNVRDAVRQPLTISASIAPGVHELRGTLTYYYCSDEEGWCRKERHPFALSLVVR